MINHGLFCSVTGCQIAFVHFHTGQGFEFRRANFELSGHFETTTILICLPIVSGSKKAFCSQSLRSLVLLLDFF